MLARVSHELSERYGEGFDARNLRFMRQFFQAYPNWNSVRSELSLDASLKSAAFSVAILSSLASTN